MKIHAGILRLPSLVVSENGRAKGIGVKSGQKYMVFHVMRKTPNFIFNILFLSW